METSMKPHPCPVSIDRRSLFPALAALVILFVPLLPVSTLAEAPSTVDALPSWNDGAAKQAIVNFVKATTDKSNPDFVPPEERIATFDQDGTLWVEHPIYSQVVYSLDPVPAVVRAKPELASVEPFKTVMSGDREAMATLTTHDLEKMLAATLTGMTVDTFNAEAKKWTEGAKDGRWKRPYTELIYQPMHEVLSYLRANGFKAYIVTGGGQDFVRFYSEKVYGIPPEQVVGTAGSTKYSYDENGKPILTKEPKLLLNDNDAGKPEGIYLMIGRRRIAAFGNSTGDQQMLEYTGAGDGLRLKMLVLHDDAEREYAYGPAQGLPDTKVGTFPQDLYDEAKKDGWIVISMKNDWKRIFGFEGLREYRTGAWRCTLIERQIKFAYFMTLRLALQILLLPKRCIGSPIAVIP
jgi:phosphoserine phosphatase